MSQVKKDSAGLTEYQRNQLHAIADWTRKMDDHWSVFGVPIGWDAILGLLPVAGDTVTTCVSLMLLNKARKMQVPRRLLLRMLGNIIIDCLVGALPLVGDLFDLGWRANTKNLSLLEQYYGIDSSQDNSTIQYGRRQVLLTAALAACLAAALYFIDQQVLYRLFV